MSTSAARPCQRCTKRGIANSCTEGHRKKAKYLLDDEELNELRRSKGPTTDKTVDAPAVEEITEPVFAPSFDPNFPFGSEAANLEYSILSAILGNPSPPDSANTPPPDFWPSVPYNPPFVTYPYQSADDTAPPPPPSSAAPDPEPPSAQDPPLHPLAPRYPLDSRPRSPPLFLSDAHDQPTSNLQTINDRITKPYDYTEGYHFLMKHLPTRFEKNDILRIVRALAIFRPSLIALQMPLSLDDEVFVEKCFQRSLLVSLCLSARFILTFPRNLTNSCPSPEHQLLFGDVPVKFVLSPPNSACSPNGLWRILSVLAKENTFTR